MANSTTHMRSVEKGALSIIEVKMHNTYDGNDLC